MAAIGSVPNAALGVAGGVATLDAVTGRVPAAQVDTVAASALTAASVLSGSEIVVLTQGGSDVRTTPAELAGVLLGSVTLASDTALSRAAHHRRVLVCTTALTLTSPSAATLGDGFECRILNVGSGSVTLGSGLTVLSGALTLAASATGTILAAAGAVYALGTGAQALAVPGTPGTPASTSVGNTSLGIQWTAPTSGGAVDYYKIMRRPTGSGSYAQLTTATTLSYLDTGLPASTGYDYQIVAHNSSGDGTASGALTATTSASLAAPNAVTGLAASAVTATTVTLAWAESGGTPSTRTVTMRTPSGSGSYAAVPGGTFGATGGVVTGLTAGSTYDFQVLETNATNAGATTPVTTLTNVSTTVAAPGAVTALATGAVSDTTAVLTWTAPSGGGAVSSYSVQQRSPTGSGTFTAATMSVAASATGGTVSGLAAGQTYDFQVTTMNAGGTATTVLSSVLTRPNQVTGLAAGVITATTVALAWTNATGATAWTVEQRTTAGPGAWGAATLSVAAAATGATVSGLTTNTAYDFRVTASNATGASPGTIPVLGNVTPVATAPVPGQVTGVTLSKSSSTKLPISWTAPGTGGAPSGYLVELSTDGATGAAFGTPITVNSTDIYYEATVTAGTAYVVRVTAFNSGGNGTVSANSASITTPASSAFQGSLSGVPTSGQVGQPISGISVTWANNPSLSSLGVCIVQNGVLWPPVGEITVAISGVSGTATLPAIYPGASGPITIRVMNAATGSTALTESRPVAIAASGTADQSYTLNASYQAIVTGNNVPASVLAGAEYDIALRIKNTAGTTEITTTNNGQIKLSTSPTDATAGALSMPTAVFEAGTGWRNKILGSLLTAGTTYYTHCQVGGGFVRLGSFTVTR